MEKTINGRDLQDSNQHGQKSTRELVRSERARVVKSLSLLEKPVIDPGTKNIAFETDSFWSAREVIE